MQKWRWWVLGAIGLGILLYWIWPSPYCRSAKKDFGIEVAECPDGKVRQVLGIRGRALRRGGKGFVRLSATALYTVAKADRWRRATIPEVDAKLFLVDGKGKERPLLPDKSVLKPRKLVKRGRGWVKYPVWLPSKLDDGDYLLRARVKTKVAEGVVDLPLPLYAPARIHVITDRPLYEPGNRVKFRALALRSRDLSPLDNRPGTWLVKDPGGNVLLEEKAPAGPWGVVAGNFLLDSEAAHGNWSVVWRSGGKEGQAQIRVEPFTLPRFRVSATPDKPFYQAGGKPTVKGSVIYSSGAPVQGAKVGLRWSINGAWPAPPSWMKGGLPTSAKTDASGRFTLALPAVPADLQGRVTLDAQVTAIDPAGDRVAGALSVLLSKDALRVAAITPLANGLVQGFNNRIYLRVTTADGRPLPGARLTVNKAWMQDAESIEADLDAESVARIQIDPGAPVNVVIPPVPVRKEANDDAVVKRTRSYDLIAGGEASLDDQVRMDRWLKSLESCAKWYDEDESEAELALRVSASGAVTSRFSESVIGKCVGARIGRGRLAAGKERLYGMTFEFSEPQLPRLDHEIFQAYGESSDELTQLVARAARDARDCLPRKGEGDLPWVLTWRLDAKARKVRASWVRRGSAAAMRKMAGAERCILSRLMRHQLPEPAKSTALGVVRYSLQQADSDDEDSRPQPTIMKGYELIVAASAQGKSVGKTKLRLVPGHIPALTLRVEPVLAKPGAKVKLRMLRGPSYRGKLPRHISVEHMGNTKSLERKKGQKIVEYTIPKEKKGWFSFSVRSARALVFARAQSELAVSVKAQKERYAPGSRARLLVNTTSQQRGVKAAVGLFGVDSSLEQLVKLPGADALRALRSKVPMKAKAFGILDGQALALGRIRGDHAAEATVMQVASIPRPEDLDVVINASATTPFDANAELVDRFYRVLAVLHEQVRQWERKAPKAELMKPATMAKLWNKALGICEQRKLRVRDAFDRPLRLHRLPADLLALTNPRQVVAVGTRLPEDVENWSRWVAQRRP